MSDGADGHSKQIENGPRKKPFLLCELKEGGKDKLGHEVEELLWLAQNYAIYRSRPGVYIQFSDFPEQEADQRKRFTEISPELCELRYLTYEMRSRPAIGFRWRTDRQPSTLYEHNIAQALMLVIEDKETEGKQIAQQALKMAVQRVTNDNTVRYLRACLIFWIILVTIGVALLFFLPSHEFNEFKNFVVAAISGATGAVLSVAIRLQAFQLTPCHQSNMNYWMSCTRVGIGLIAGPILLLLSQTTFGAQMNAFIAPTGQTGWQAIAILGLIGGFTERLIPNLLGKTTDKIESPAGTPVQAARSEAAHPAQ